MGESYPSAANHSVYSTAPANWAKQTFVREWRNEYIVTERPRLHCEERKRVPCTFVGWRTQETSLSALFINVQFCLLFKIPSHFSSILYSIVLWKMYTQPHSQATNLKPSIIYYPNQQFHPELGVLRGEEINFWNAQLWKWISTISARIWTLLGDFIIHTNKHLYHNDHKYRK